MNAKERKAEFELNRKTYESVLMRFIGIDGYDVYNCSCHFEWEGKRYIFGRVEKRNIWADSHVMLFSESGKDEWALDSDFPRLALEDPFVSVIDGEIILGGTHVRKVCGEIDSYFCYFYRGDLNEMQYFTTGPDYMKDIRLIQLKNGKIGVFSRPHGEVYAGGAKSMIGYTEIDSVNELSPELIASAPYIEGIFGDGEWGGVNQAVELKNGLIGCISHLSFEETAEDDEILLVYTNTAFVFDPKSRKISDFKMIGCRSCYPDCSAKKPSLVDCAFTSGIVLRDDGKAELYSGIGDTHEARITIDDPFIDYR